MIFSGSWDEFFLRDYEIHDKYITVVPIDFCENIGTLGDSKYDTLPTHAIFGRGKDSWGDFVALVYQWGYSVCCVHVYLGSNVRTVGIYVSDGSGLALLGQWSSNWYNLGGTALLANAKIVATASDLLLKTLANTSSKDLRQLTKWDGYVGNWLFTFTYQDGRKQKCHILFNHQQKCKIEGAIKRTEDGSYKRSNSYDFRSLDKNLYSHVEVSPDDTMMEEAEEQDAEEDEDMDAEEWGLEEEGDDEEDTETEGWGEAIRAESSPDVMGTFMEDRVSLSMCTHGNSVANYVTCLGRNDPGIGMKRPEMMQGYFMEAQLRTPRISEAAQILWIEQGTWTAVQKT